MVRGAYCEVLIHLVRCQGSGSAVPRGGERSRSDQNRSVISPDSLDSISLSSASRVYFAKIKDRFDADDSDPFGDCVY